MTRGRRKGAGPRKRLLWRDFARMPLAGWLWMWSNVDATPPGSLAVPFVASADPGAVIPLQAG
jgi:hypothetical protein